MTYQDALDYLRIAENAYNVQAYSESAEIVEKLAYYWSCETSNRSFYFLSRWIYLGKDMWSYRFIQMANKVKIE